MSEKTIKIPGPEHPITIAQNPKRVVVTVGGRVIADTSAALSLRESHYPVVHYVPRADVNMAALARSATQSYCPYKGEAAYFSVPAGGERAIDAVWTYETPFPAVGAIQDYLAFYPDRVDSIEERD